MVDEVTATVVIPCYNEEARLPVETFESSVRDFPTIKFIFVDDGSTDGTLGLLRTLSRDHPHRFGILGFESNRGKAEAVRKGMLQGLTERPAFIGYWDADLSTPLDAIPLFLDVFKNQAPIEMVLGSRLKSLGRVILRKPFRHYGGRIIATGISLITGLHVYDSQCGAKLFRVTPLLDRIFETPFVSSWFFDVEILVRLSQMHSARTTEEINQVFYELPLPVWKDVRGSKVSLRDVVSIPIDLLRIWLRY